MRPFLKVITAVTILTAALLPYLLPSFYVGIARDILIFALFALSIELLVGFGGLPTLGQAGISGTSAYVVAVLVVTHGVGPELAALVAIMAAIALALFFGLLNVRTRGTYFLLITLAQGMIVWGLAIRWSSVTNGFDGITGIVRPDWLSQYRNYYWFVLIVAVVVLIGVRNVTRSPFGLTLLGIRASESRMRTLGYNVPLHRLVTFVFSGSIAGLAGVLLAFGTGFVSPNSASLARSAEGLLMVLLGGPGTIIGSVVGAALVVLARNVVSIWTDRWLLVLGLGYVFVVLTSPNGIVPALRGWGTRYRSLDRFFSVKTKSEKATIEAGK